ncbi:putative transporter YybO [Reticulibacter mediterranei]|uniref:Putative transporter YybO n=1 Tax=Reticulibacter mediterranei TaxID=2778369 RepID=A0A8J3IF39_9CHLR|nr:MFS transporter [Reticulibacter mediterranei]GHO93251.1 putative transporter YybO [Reticulibacter mediterranei]
MVKKRVGGLRWAIAILLGIGIIINYFDRLNISVAAGPLTQEYHLSATQLGFILSSYLWTYTLLQLPIGALLDKIGIKWLMRVGTVIWSIATFMTAIVSGYGLIILSRFLLGIAEAPTFPGASKATGYWFPMNERGLATSAFDAAAKFSNVIGAPLVAAAITIYGWRAGFWVTGVLSLIYAAVFWLLYRDPKEARRLSEEERTYIVEGGAQQEEQTGASTSWADTWTNIRYLLRQRKIWAMTLGFAAYGYSFYLLLTWLPGYLQRQLHVSILSSSYDTAIVWGVATITDILIGGWLVDYLIRRGYDPSRVRKTLFAIGMIIGVAVIGAAFTTDPTIATIWIAIALGGLAFAAPIGWSIPALIAPKGTVGTTGSIMNFFNNLVGIIAPIVAGYIADRTGGFAINFLVAGIVLLLGIAAYLLMLGKIEQLPSPMEKRSPAPPITTGAHRQSA